MSRFYKIQLCLLFIVAITFSACKNNKSSDEPEKETTDSLGIAKSDTALTINLASPVAEEKILLQFKPEIGTTYYFTNNSNYTALRRVDSVEVKAKSTKYAKIKMIVSSKDKDNYKIEFSLTDARKTIKDDSSEINYQFGKPMADPGQDVDRQIEDCLVNSPITLTMNAKGEAVNMEGYEAIIAKMKTILQAATGKEVPDQYIAQQMSLPTENIDNLFIVFPDTAVRIGDTWEYTASSELQGMPVVISSKYTLADRKDGITYINLSAVVTIDRDNLPKEIIAQMTNLVVTSYMKGTIRIDEKTGWPQQMKLTQFVEIKDVYEGQTSYSKETGTTTITVAQ